jgi:hypothetical protein
MSTRLSRIISIILYVLLAISVIFAFLFYMGKKVPGTEGTSFEEPQITQTVLLWAYILVGIAAVAAVIIPIFNLIKNPASAKNLLIVVVIFAVLIGISYLLSSSHPISFLKVDATAKTLKWVGTGLITAYIFAAVAFLGILAYEISSLFR